VKTRELVRAGRIGDLRSMLGHFSYFNADPSNIRNVPEFGGGGLMDIGCYLVNTSRFVFDREPRRITGVIDRDPVLKIDRTASMVLDFGGGHLAGTCSTQMVPYQRIQICGTEGRIEIEIPFNAPPDRPCRIFIDNGADLFGRGIETIEFPACDQYTIQADLFSEAVLGGRSVSLPLEDSIRNMACIDAVFRSAESGRWEAPAAG
jgi:predicted dehydrogenase